MKGSRRWLGWFVVAGIAGVGVHARVEQTPSLSATLRRNLRTRTGVG